MNKEKGIVFCTQLVPKILAGTKTVTRRCHKRLMYQPGDVLYLRECYAPFPELLPAGYHVPGSIFYGRTVWYKADHNKPTWGGPWKSGRFMPKKYAREERYRIVSATWTALQDIDEEDAEKEGIVWVDHEDEGGHWEVQVRPGTRHAESGLLQTDDAVEAFAFLWDSLNGKRDGCAWKDNRTVARYEWEPINV
jgi:hypothetical protein